MHKKSLSNKLLLSLFVALHFHGTYNALMGGPFAVVGLWPLVVAFIPFAALLQPSLLTFNARASLGIFLFTAILFGIPKSPQLGYAISIAAVAFFNLFFLVSLNPRITDFSDFRRSIYKVSSYIAVASIVLFVVMFPIAMSHIGTLGYRPGYGVVLDRGILPRAAGFNGDSNFFAILLGLAAMAYFEEGRNQGPKWGIYAIVLALVASMSRSAIVGLIICYAMFYARPSHVYKIIIGVALAILIGPIFIDADVLTTIIDRRINGTFGDESRLNLWLPKLERYDLTWFGNGLNIMKHDTGLFSHNTFLDVIIELGVVGAILFLIFLAGSFAMMARASRYARASFTFVFLMLPFFSLLYSPILALPLLLSAEKKRRKQQKGHPAHALRI